MQTLICYTINGWPEKHQILKELFPYYSHCSEIMYHEGIPHEKINQYLTDINRYLTDTENHFYKALVILFKYWLSIGYIG